MRQAPAQRPSPLFVPTAIAVAVMLAACGGGGGGSDRKVSSSPSPNAQGGSGSNVTLNINAGTGAIADAITSGSGPNATTPPPSSNPGSGTGTTAPPTSGDPITVPPAPTPPATPKPDQGSTPTPPTAGTSNPGSGSSNGDANTTPPATTPDTIPLVSDQGVRGEVLLAMFDQKACQGEFNVHRVESLDGPSLSQDTAIKDDTPPVLTKATWLNHSPYTFNMDVWKQHGSNPPARAPGYVYECHYPEIRSYANPVKPGDYVFNMISGGRYHTYLTMRYYGSPYITKGVNTASVDYPLTVNDTDFIVRGQVKLNMEEDQGYKATDISGRDVPPGNKSEGWLEGSARTYQRQGLVPFGALNQWQRPTSPTDDRLQLLLIKADEPNTVRLCTHLHTTMVKRLHCVTWQVPTDWSWGKELIGGKQYLIEDRTSYNGETGFMFWR